jgi:PhnB protein
MKLIPYLIFQGNSEEVLNTYQKIFNGTIHDLSRFGDGNFPMPEEQKSKIMHARLSFDENMIMISDGMPGKEYNQGTGFHLSIGLTDEAQARSIFGQLAEGGEIEMPLEVQFWGALYGQVIDRFGVNWMINCEL